MASGEYGILNEEKDPLGQKRKGESEKRKVAVAAPHRVEKRKAKEGKRKREPRRRKGWPQKGLRQQGLNQRIFLPQKGTKVVPGFGRDRLRAYRRDGVPVVTSENFAHFLRPPIIFHTWSEIVTKMHDPYRQ